jgi:F-type H+-transporting ATPase subunit epsilon
VAWGFVEVLPERVTILAETALHPNEIDRPRRRQELRQGEELWHEAGDDATSTSRGMQRVTELEEGLLQL